MAGSLSVTGYSMSKEIVGSVGHEIASIHHLPLVPLVHYNLAEQIDLVLSPKSRTAQERIAKDFDCKQVGPFAPTSYC